MFHVEHTIAFRMMTAYLTNEKATVLPSRVRQHSEREKLEKLNFTESARCGFAPTYPDHPLLGESGNKESPSADDQQLT